MRVLIVVLLTVGAYAKVIRYEPIISGDEYHEKIGIPEYERIRLAEEQLLLDPSRIVGGSLSNAGQIPWQGGLLVDLIIGGSSLCGCTLLSFNRALTAAHCWVGGIELMAVFGSTMLFSGGTRVFTNNVEIHKDYDQRTFNNDIAMITLWSVDFNNNIQPIAVAFGTATYIDRDALTSGFGLTSDNEGIGSNPPLSHVTLTVIPNSVCALTYGNEVVVDSTLCTSGAGGKGICGGDSGGPLTITSGSQRILIGVTSFRAQTGCEAGMPSGFARVTSFNGWIRDRL